MKKLVIFIFILVSCSTFMPNSSKEQETKYPIQEICSTIPEIITEATAEQKRIIAGIKHGDMKSEKIGLAKVLGLAYLIKDARSFYVTKCLPV